MTTSTALHVRLIRHRETGSAPTGQAVVIVGIILVLLIVVALVRVSRGTTGKDQTPATTSRSATIAPTDAVSALDTYRDHGGSRS